MNLSHCANKKTEENVSFYSFHKGYYNELRFWIMNLQKITVKLLPVGTV